MSDAFEDRARALESRLTELEGENEILIERAEDILLLGLVTEAISRQDEPGDIMATALERISILKDVPYCALVTLDGRVATLNQEYSLFREKSPGETTFEVSPGVADELRQGAAPVPDEDLSSTWRSLGFGSLEPRPKSALLIPFVTTHHDRAALLLADPERRSEGLASLLPLLEQVISAAAARVENASLFRELDELTENLNRLVRERTKALGEANDELKKEVAERRRAEKEVKLAATFFQRAREGIIITSPDTTILTINQAFSSITGYSEQEIVGKTPAVLASGRHDREFYESMWTALENSGGWRGEIWNRRKSGVVYLESLSITAVRNDDGELTHYVGMFSEVGDR